MAINGNFATAYDALGLAHERKKKFPEAIAAYQKYLDLSGHDADAIMRLAEGYAAAGSATTGKTAANNIAEARNLLHELEHPAKGMFVTANNPAAVYSMLGENDKAFELLDLGLKQRATDMRMVRWDPPFDPLRADPRFEALCRKLGFPK